jgi:hypothetical protein
LFLDARLDPEPFYLPPKHERIVHRVLKTDRPARGPRLPLQDGSSPRSRTTCSRTWSASTPPR